MASLDRSSSFKKNRMHHAKFPRIIACVSDIISLGTKRLLNIHLRVGAACQTQRQMAAISLESALEGDLQIIKVFV